MTGLAFLGFVGMIEIQLRDARRRMERRKAAIDEITAMTNGPRVQQTRDVKANESRMLDYFEAVDAVAALLDEKNRAIDLIEEKLSLLRTPNGEAVIYGRYIENKSMEAIASELHYSRAGIYKLLKKAMAELDDLLADYNPSEAIEDFQSGTKRLPAVGAC